MRIEQPHLFFYGALLFACAWMITLAISSTQLKLHLKAIVFALGLGVIIVPGHGEFIVAPVLAAFTPPWRTHLVVLGGVFFLIWWVVAIGLLRKLTHHSNRPPNGAP
jgi:hypothetical protein